MLAKSYILIHPDHKDMHHAYYLKLYNYIRCNYYNSDNDFNMKELHYLHDYLQAFGDIVCVDVNVLNIHCDFLLSLIVTIIRKFPEIKQNHHYYVIGSVLDTLEKVERVDRKTYNYILRNAIYEGVQWSCSHNSEDEIVSDNDEQKQILTYKCYVPFWKGLLNNTHRLTTMEYRDESKSIHQSIYYDNLCKELIYTMLRLIKKLNLKIVNKKAEDADDVGLVELNVEAEAYHDFKIFVNLIDFYSVILQCYDKTMIRRYILHSIKHVIKLSVMNPLVIGHYKLLTVWLRIARETDYFAEVRIKNRTDLRECCELLSSFTYDLLLTMREYEENLQMVCLEFLMSLPIYVIRNHLPNVTTQMIVILKLGYLNIVEMVIDTLDCLYLSIQEIELEPYLRQILPHLDSYLRSSTYVNNDTAINVNRKTITTLKKRQIVIEAKPGLYNLQKKILRFFGRLSSKLCVTFAEDTSVIRPLLWSNSNYLEINFVCKGEKNVIVNLDKLLPTITYLALNCSNRKARFASCELLHLIVTLTLDKSKVNKI